MKTSNTLALEQIALQRRVLGSASELQGLQSFVLTHKFYETELHWELTSPTILALLTGNLGSATALEHNSVRMLFFKRWYFSCFNVIPMLIIWTNRKLNFATILLVTIPVVLNIGLHLTFNEHITTGRTFSVCSLTTYFQLSIHGPFDFLHIMPYFMQSSPVTLHLKPFYRMCQVRQRPPNHYRVARMAPPG